MTGEVLPVHRDVFRALESQMMRPLDFIIAGVQKGGTTALWTFLSQHPQIFVAPTKELHFFDNEWVDWARPDYSSLHQYFAGQEDGKKLGEATPIYTYWRPSAERIFRYNPAIRLIMLLRNPVERAHSHWVMEAARNRDQATFGEAIREGRSRVAQNAEICGCHRVFSYVERGFYAEQIERLLSLFTPEQLLFLRTEDLWERHTETLGRVCDFLGVDEYAKSPQQEFILKNARGDYPPIASEDSSYLLTLYRDDLARTEVFTGLDLSAWRT